MKAFQRVEFEKIFIHLGNFKKHNMVGFSKCAPEVFFWIPIGVYH